MRHAGKRSHRTTASAGDSVERYASAWSGRLSSAVLSGCLFVAALGAFTWRLDDGPIYRTMEGREALVVQEIVRSGNWVLPLRNGDTIPSKPPLFHWLGALASRASGRVSEGTVRFPSAAASAAGVAVTFLLGGHLFGRGAGLLGALMLFTMPMYAATAREAWVDASFAFFVLLALTTFYLMYDSGRWRGWRGLALALAVAGAVLSKGPSGYILIALVVVLFAVVDSGPSALWTFVWSTLRHSRAFWLGVAVAVLLPATWYVLAFREGGEAFLLKQLWTENLRRFLAGQGEHREPLSFFVEPFLRGGFPWNVLAVWGTIRLVRDPERRRKALFPLVWWVVIFGFFSLSAGKRAIYILPLFPATALLAAGWAWSGVRDARSGAALPRFLRGVVLWLTGAVGVLVLGFVVLAATHASEVDPNWIATTFGKQTWNQVVFPLRLASEHPLYAVIVTALLAGSLFFTAMAVARGRWRDGMVRLLLLSLVYNAGAYPFFHAYYKEFRGLKPFAVETARIVGPAEPLYAYRLPELSQIYFYLDRHVPPAPCERIWVLTECPAGYYLLWEDTWEKRRSQLDGGAAEVLASRSLSGPQTKIRTVLVRLEGSIFSRSPDVLRNQAPADVFK